MTAPVGMPEALGAIREAVSQRAPEASGAALPQGHSGQGVTPFGERLRDIVEESNAVQRDAQAQAEAFADGRSNDMHGTMIGLAQADIQLRFVSNVRNRIVEAYREVMRMGA